MSNRRYRGLHAHTAACCSGEHMLTGEIPMEHDQVTADRRIHAGPRIALSVATRS
jgi:hypothetical protein